MKTQRGLISSLFWRILASAGPEMANIKTKDEDDDFSMEFLHLMGLVLWGYLNSGKTFKWNGNTTILIFRSWYSYIFSEFLFQNFQGEFLNPLEIFPVPFRWIY
jgi:hypothetical protein